MVREFLPRLVLVPGEEDRDGPPAWGIVLDRNGQFDCQELHCSAKISGKPVVLPQKVCWSGEALQDRPHLVLSPALDAPSNGCPKLSTGFHFGLNDLPDVRRDVVCRGTAISQD